MGGNVDFWPFSLCGALECHITHKNLLIEYFEKKCTYKGSQWTFWGREHARTPHARTPENQLSRLSAKATGKTF